jgi:uncharacterized protein YbbC (DUF1343 family)
MKKVSLFISYALLMVVAITSCKSTVAQSANGHNGSKNNNKVIRKDTIRTGADQTNKYLSYLKGKRVAILANQTSIIGDRHMVDSLQSLGVNIVKVFGPEHGFRGNASAGVHVADEKDKATGIPIISYMERKTSLRKKTWQM